MVCPHCHNTDENMIEDVTELRDKRDHPDKKVWFCHNCSKTFKSGPWTQKT